MSASAGLGQGGMMSDLRARAWRRVGLVGAVVALLATAVPAARAEWDPEPFGDVVTSQRYRCGADDRPEGPIQGHVPKADQNSGRAEEGYNCGLALTGHTRLGRDGRPGPNANMAWAGRCAYVAGAAGLSPIPQVPQNPPPGAGVAVVSVSDAGVPTHVATLRSPGALATAETLHAITTPGGRSILVVGQYGNDIFSDPKPMDVYDVSDPDCTKFRRLPNPDAPDDPTKASFYWPGNIHNLTISGDGRTVFGTLPLQAADISGFFDGDPRTGGRYLGNIESAIPGLPISPGPAADLDDLLPPLVRDSTHPTNASHEAWSSFDGTTLYVGGVTVQSEILSVLDLREWLARRPDGSPKGPIRVISQESGRAHSIRTATIHGVPYLLHSEESVFGSGFGCLPETLAPFAGPAQPWLTNIGDPTDPVTVSQFGLEVNEPASCLDQMASNENSSVHYHDVDDPEDTTFVMASMWNAGIRVFDVRDPVRPTEVAYFNPGDVDPGPGVLLDQAWGHVRYVPETGHIWFATADGGFYVVRIEAQVRRLLDLDAKNREHHRRVPKVPANDRGAPGTRGASTAAVVPGATALPASAPWYCTLPTT